MHCYNLVCTLSPDTQTVYILLSMYVHSVTMVNEHIFLCGSVHICQTWVRLGHLFNEYCIIYMIVVTLVADMVLIL